MVVIASAMPVESTIRASHSGQAGLGVTSAKTPITMSQKETLMRSEVFIPK